MTGGARRRNRLAERLFRAALRVLPGDMRERDGAEIEALFAHESEEARASGVPPSTAGPASTAAFVPASRRSVTNSEPHTRTTVLSLVAGCVKLRLDLMDAGPLLEVEYVGNRLG